ncbi:MAG: hypothetical protein HWE34_05300 [Methylocystaceae bacterium]|jgi:hypothetical protein|nr:hypothetical protein [Methylocystaceae bacterium]
MATKESQARWRNKNSLVKKQLNVMAKRLIHEDLEDMAKTFDLKGKAEAVTFTAFVTKALQQQAEYNPEAKRILTLLETAYKRDREIYRP